jgi:ABC-type antimicrobial peptide transport system permease subunit
MWHLQPAVLNARSAARLPKKPAVPETPVGFVGVGGVKTIRLGVLKFARFKILKISARNSKRSRSWIIDYDAFGMTAISLGAVPCLSGQSMVIVTFGQNRSLPARQRGLVRSESTKPAYAKNDPYALVPAITREIHEIAADQPVEHASTLDDIRAEVMTPDRLNAVVFGGFASLALLISVVGVAGVLAFSVSGRTREFGIRLALGASPRHVLTDVLLEGLVIAVIGVTTGVVAGFFWVRAIAQYTTDFQVPGALPLIASAALILAAALIASALPAARAARVDTVQALRSE